MRFQIHAETLAKSLQGLGNIVEKRQTNPILGYFLLECEPGRLVVTATDLEIEIVLGLPLEEAVEGAATVPAKKFVDICRAIPGHEMISFELKGQFVKVETGTSRFTLNTMPVEDFPKNETEAFVNQYEVTVHELKDLLERTAFAMAIQDVRTFLNGMLLEFEGDQIRAVSTDAHRLAMCEKNISRVEGEGKNQIIVPRKAVLEMMRLVDTVDATLTLSFNQNHVRLDMEDFQFTSKLLDGVYPNYQRVIPQGGKIIVKAERELIKQSLNRAAILATEKYKGVLIKFEEGNAKIEINNPEQEVAEVEMPVDYTDPPLEIGFNISYLLDVVNTLKKETIVLQFIDTASSCLVTEPDNDECKYVVMPMRV